MLSKTALTRINKELRMLKVSPLGKEKIYVIPDEDDITLARALIIGPDDTPYENGMYFYEIRFPDNYPFSPLKAKYMTNDGNTRMHPNFYSCGKVCVSIIGTWSGPGWTSCQNITSVLLTFRSLFLENPLWQEPGFADEVSDRNSDYNTLIGYENYRIAILKMFNNTPPGFNCFRDIMREHLVKNQDAIMERCQKNKIIKGVYNSPQIYCFNRNINYLEIYEKLQLLYGVIGSELKDPNQNHQQVISDLVQHLSSHPNISYKDLMNSTKTIMEDQDVNLDNLITIMEIRDLITRNPKNELTLTT